VFREGAAARYYLDPGTTRSAAGWGMKVLIAEDDRASSMLLRRLLEELGHEVVAVTNGADAIEQLTRKDDLQVVVSDWLMPVMDGLELCERIRARERARYVYVLIVTARRGKKRYLEALEAGADDFIFKPIDAEELGARLRVAERILGLQAQMKQLQGLLSICAYCKNIREDEDTWVPIEQFVSQRAHTMFSHGICPSCAAKHFKEWSAKPPPGRAAGRKKEQKVPPDQ